MIKRKNLIYIIVFLIINVFLFCGVYYFADFNKIMSMGNDFHFNMISAASIIGGFLFTGLGVLLGAIDNEKVRRIWNHHYLDNFYRISIFGIAFDVITIFLAIIILCFEIPTNIIKFMLSTELSLIVSGLLSFALGIKDLAFIIKLLKSEQS